MDRLARLAKHLAPEASAALKPQCVGSFQPAGDDDIVIVEGIRTAICKAKRGSFNQVEATELLTPCLKYVVKDIDPALVDDVVVGTVLPRSGKRAGECRMAMFLAGYPKECSVRTVNRQCSSGLQAIADVASAIQAGYIDVGVAAGLEVMTKDSMAMQGSVADDVKQNNDALNCLLPMGITSENVASKYGVTRQEQDEFAVLSHKRAAAARDKFRQEILPLTVTFKDRKTGEKKVLTVRDDDGVRPNTSLAGLSKLKPAFKKGGTTTAGNSSQVSDGAAAVLMMKRSRARQLGLKVMGRFTNFAVAGVDPAVMGIGPAAAIPKVLDQAGLGTADIDLYEINEAFASQAVYCVKKLGLSSDNVNVNGGAIAFGHPLGCTGARMAVTLLKEMERRGSKRGIVSMCIGTGMGAAGIFERV